MTALRGIRRGGAVAVLACAFLAGCAVDDAPKIAVPASMMPSSSIAEARVIPVGERVALPNIPGLQPDGRPMVLNAWASWCVPCREEAPELAEFAKDNTDVRVVGLNVNDDAGAAAAFSQATGMTYEQVTDADGSILATIPGIPPAGLPSTVIVDADGMIVATIIGPARGQLASLAAQALRKG